MPTSIAVDLDAVADLCRRNHIEELSLFGSVLREGFRPSSDVDMLVAFEPGHTPGFVGLHYIEQELSELLDGRRVDLVTRKFLNHRIRDAVLAEAEVLYAKG